MRDEGEGEWWFSGGYESVEGEEATYQQIPQETLTLGMCHKL